MTLIDNGQKSQKPLSLCKSAKSGFLTGTIMFFGTYFKYLIIAPLLCPMMLPTNSDDDSILIMIRKSLFTECRL